MKYQHNTAANRHLTPSGSAQSGYTLIELMTAIAIIGILAASVGWAFSPAHIMQIYHAGQNAQPTKTLA